LSFAPGYLTEHTAASSRFAIFMDQLPNSLLTQRLKSYPNPWCQQYSVRQDCAEHIISSRSIMRFQQTFTF